MKACNFDTCPHIADMENEIRVLKHDNRVLRRQRDTARECLQESITAHTGCNAAGEYVCGPGYTDQQMERWMREVGGKV